MPFFKCPTSARPRGVLDPVLGGDVPHRNPDVYPHLYQISDNAYTKVRQNVENGCINSSSSHFMEILDPYSYQNQEKGYPYLYQNCEKYIYSSSTSPVPRINLVNHPQTAMTNALKMYCNELGYDIYIYINIWHLAIHFQALN